MNTSIYRQFWRYTIPTIAAMLVNGLYQVVDGIFIGHYVGAAGLAGINVAWPLIGSILGIGLMVGVGTGALASIRLGEKQPQKAQAVLSTGLVLLLLMSPVVSILLWCFADDFLRLQGAQGEVFQLGLQYLDVLVFSCLFTLGSIAMPILLRNDGSPNLATMLMVLGAITNIVLDYLFIGLLQWQLTGAAIATALAQMVVLLVGLSYFFSRKAKLRLSKHNLSFQWRLLPQIFAIGTSSFFMYAYGSMMVALHNSLLLSYGSPVLVGAYAILGYIIVVYYLIAEGIANGMQPLASFYHGAGHSDNIKKLLKIAMSSAVLTGMVFIGLLNIFPEQVVAVFNANDAELTQHTITGIRLHMFAMFLDGFLVVTAAYYQSVNRGGKALFVSIGNMMVQLPFLFIMPKLLGITGVWLAFPLSNIALTLVVAVMLWRDIKRMPKNQWVEA
ncbi:MATE family efflux transporter [Vibrio vulnificus]|uniref:MATE family efflux transporter n=1 Tax=Vibrio vulnificus TaxID=672 RepID=UPI0019D4B434|nr:MATE family efflux transporter [Vibrio vulnificus]MBN8091685.1 MATE family efflux transporter [Vibrio vulnificus]HAS6051315.1 MATE family efflux transporter [Vibrio vulnificus]HDY7892687.1 MATE family efflux transporter [Vibrio vulnificus]